MEIIQEFKEALDHEIQALKKGKGSGIVSINNGQFLKQTLEIYIYQFNLENFLIIIEDTPAILEVSGKEYECEIISVNGQQIQLSVKEKLPELIPVAKIKTNTWYLLELLKKKFEEHENDTERFSNSHKLFSGKSDKIDGDSVSPTYSMPSNDIAPNESQHKAISSSLNDFISIIWGPPGTGKTATIARAIESHLNLGRKVLLLSHANNAVDQALEKIAFQTRNSYYKDCKLVRLGTPKAEALQKFENKFPLVLMDKIVEHKSLELTNQKNKLLKKLDETNSKIKQPEAIITLWNEIEKIAKLVEQEEANGQKIERTIKNLREETQSLEEKSKRLKKKLEELQNAGAIKKFFLGLNPEKIQEEITEISKKIKSNFIQIQNLTDAYQKNKITLNKHRDSKRIATKNLQFKLKNYSNIDKVKQKGSSVTFVGMFFAVL